MFFSVASSVPEFDMVSAPYNPLNSKAQTGRGRNARGSQSVMLIGGENRVTER